MVTTAVIVNDTCEVIGGAAEVAIETAALLADEGLKVIFVCSGGTPDKRLIDSQVEIRSTNTPLFLEDPNRFSGALRGIWSKDAKKLLESTLEGCPTGHTIVNIHSWTKGLSSSVFSACIAKNIPYVITVHDYFLCCPNGGFFNYQRGRQCGCDALSPRCVVCNCDRRSYAEKLYRILRSLIQRHVLGKGKTRLAFLSSFSRDILETQIKFKYNYFEIRNPIAAKTLQIDNCSQNTNYDLLYVGRVDQEKGVAELCSAAKKAGVRVVLAGSGEQFNQLKKQYMDFDWLGWCDKNTINKYAAQSKLLVFPSLWYEVSPLTVLEIQQATGIPSLVSSLCAASEQIVDDISGSQFNPLVEDDFLTKINYALRHRYGTRKEISEIAKSLSGNTEMYKKKLISIFEQINQEASTTVGER